MPIHGSIMNRPPPRKKRKGKRKGREREREERREKPCKESPNAHTS